MKISRHIVSFCLMLAGFLLVLGGNGFGPLGKHSFFSSTSPFLEFLVSTLGLELITGTYFLVKASKHEGKYRIAIYAILFISSLSFFLAVLQVSQAAISWRSPEILYGALLGCAAIANLVVFFGWAGVADAPRSDKGDAAAIDTFVTWLLILQGFLLPAGIVISDAFEDWFPLVWFFVMGAICVGSVILATRNRLKPAWSTSIGFVLGATLMFLGGLLASDIVGGFEGSAAVFVAGFLVAVPTAIICALLARRQSRL